ncbi:MAG: SGNH/GDSL hydrolase family protein [Candidatus Omnitrophica bacterium]|nr:SGNH/GDSL hydrolase family protein [Candidatus Omnitrophota bacterium]
MYSGFLISTASIFFCLFALEGWLRVTHLGVRRYLPPGAYQSHPTRRYTLKPNFTGLSLGVPFQTNSKGFRDLERSYEKKRGMFRILCIGDSVTFGPGLPFEQTYPQMLEKRLRSRFPKKHIEVLNMSVPSYNTVYEAQLLEEEGIRYHPDLVVIGYVYNDSGYNFEFYHQQVGKALAGEPYVLDLLDFFLGKKASDFWVTSFDGHPNEKANRVVRDVLEHFLLEHQLL